MLAGRQAPELWDYLRASLNGVLYVPIWTEPIIPATQSDNWRTITTTTDFSGYFNLIRLTRQLILTDTTQANDPGLLMFEAIDSPTEILTGANAAYAGAIANTVIYPAFPAILELGQEA